VRWCVDGQKGNFARGKIPSGGKISQKCIYNVPGQETAIHRAKFGWHPVSDVAVVTKANAKPVEIYRGGPNSPTDLSC